MIFKRQVNHVWLERFVLASVGEHPLVVKMHYSFQDHDHLYFIMEYLHGGDMMTMLIRQEYLPESWAKFYIAELVVAIDALHRTGIIHRDIKPDNILFRKNGHICLSDFGLSKSLMQPTERDWLALTGAEYVNRPNFIEHIRRGDIDLPLKDRVRLWKALAKEYAFSQVGTPNYIAPEVLQDHSYTESCDWWSVGVILYEMLVGCPPFCARNPAHVTSMICQWRRYLSFPHDLPEDRVSPAARDLIHRLLCESPNRIGGKRGLAEFKEHPFFKGIDWDNLAEAEAPFIPQLSSDTDTRYFEDEITKTDISQVVLSQSQEQHHTITHEEAPESVTSGSSGSAGKDGSVKSGKLPRRRSSRRLKYDRNMDLEFVGFTFIPMNSMRPETHWESSRHDFYNPPASARADQKISAMTEALSLEGNPAESKAKPLRSPRGRAAEAAIAAARVASAHSRNEGNSPPWGDHRIDVTKIDGQRDDIGESVRGVRFVDTTNANDDKRMNQQRLHAITSDEMSTVSNGPPVDDDDVMLEEDHKVSTGTETDDNNGFDEIDEGIGAMRVEEVVIEDEDSMWSGQARSEHHLGEWSLHSSLSLPELSSKSREEEDTEEQPESRAVRRSASSSERDSDGSIETVDDGVQRRTSRLNMPVNVTQSKTDVTPQPSLESRSSSKDGQLLPPTLSEVDRFVGYASRRIDTAARELTSTHTSNVPAVVRHAKEQLNGTAVRFQETLGPGGSTTPANEEESECLEPAISHLTTNSAATAGAA